MATKPRATRSNPPTSDPDNVQEIICNGRFHVHAYGQLATITFTHQRPDAAALIDKGQIVEHSVVRARIVLTINNLVALRDLLIRITQENQPAEPQVH